MGQSDNENLFSIFASIQYDYVLLNVQREIWFSTQILIPHCTQFTKPSYFKAEVEVIKLEMSSYTVIWGGWELHVPKLLQVDKGPKQFWCCGEV